MGKPQDSRDEALTVLIQVCCLAVILVSILLLIKLGMWVF